MNSLKTRLMESAIAAAQRLSLGLQKKFEWQSLRDYEDDFDLVCVLLEEANDELKPMYEERARHQEE